MQPALIGRHGVTTLLSFTNTGHVHNVIGLYQHTIHVQVHSVDQSQEPDVEPWCSLRPGVVGQLAVFTLIGVVGASSTPASKRPWLQTLIAEY